MTVPQCVGADEEQYASEAGVSVMKFVRYLVLKGWLMKKRKKQMVVLKVEID